MILGYSISITCVIEMIEIVQDFGRFLKSENVPPVSDCDHCDRNRKCPKALNPLKNKPYGLLTTFRQLRSVRLFKRDWAAGLPLPKGGSDSHSLLPLLRGKAADWPDESISQYREDYCMIKWGDLKYQYYGDKP